MAQAKYYIALVAVCLVWGATPACGKILSTAMSPLLITGLRFFLMSGILFAWFYITGQRRVFHPDPKFIPFLMFMGFMGITFHNGLLFTGLKYTTATNTALIESIGPTVTTILAFLFVGERLSRKGWLGIFISCCGALCIVTKGSIDVLLNLEFNIGDILIVLCEMAWSGYVILGWKAQGRMSAAALTAWNGFFGAIFCFIIGLCTDSLELMQFNLEVFYGFSYLLYASGLFAFVVWNYAVAKVGASKAGVFVYMVPLTGAIIGVTFLGEDIFISQIVGGLFIVLGVIVTVRAKVQLKNKELSVQDELVDKFPDLAEHYRAKASGEEVPALTKITFKDKLKAFSLRLYESFISIGKEIYGIFIFIYKFITDKKDKRQDVITKENPETYKQDKTEETAIKDISLNKNADLPDDRNEEQGEEKEVKEADDLIINAGSGFAKDIAQMMRENSRKSFNAKQDDQNVLSETAENFVQSLDKGDDTLRKEELSLSEKTKEYSVMGLIKKLLRH